MDTPYTDDSHPGALPLLLRPGDRVRFVSPSSTPNRESVHRCAKIIESWGLKVELGKSVFHELGYLAGSDDERLADINDALRDPSICALFATTGGKGAYRIADQLDFGAAMKNPKFLVGFSDITVLHLSLWKHCHSVGIHGPLVSWSPEYIGPESIESLRRAVMTTEMVVLQSDLSEPTAALTTTGTVQGVLIGGNLDTLAISAGWALPNLTGKIILIEAVAMGLGHVDRQLTMLLNAGHLNGVKGIAVGRFTDFHAHGAWTIIDVLRDRLARLNVPILGGLPIGHDKHPQTTPLGTLATLDAEAGTLTVMPGVRASS